MRGKIYIYISNIFFSVDLEVDGERNQVGGDLGERLGQVVRQLNTVKILDRKFNKFNDKYRPPPSRPLNSFKTDF